jgi:hypothetical protein
MKSPFPYLIVAFTVILALNSIAQHCPFDGSRIMVIEIKANQTEPNSIDNLKLMVTDSLGNSVIAQYYLRSEKLSVTLKPFQNSCLEGYTASKYNPVENRCYWFALNNYVLVAPWPVFEEKLFLVIEDIDGDKNGGFFKGQTISINQDFAFPLCTKYSNWNYGPNAGFVSNYKPYVVVLERVD